MPTVLLEAFLVRVRFREPRTRFLLAFERRYVFV
jgi:hypothetical protein